VGSFLIYGENMTDTPDIAGYTPVTIQAKDSVNINKQLEEEILRRIEFLENSELDVNKRDSALARTNIQQGFMWLNRAIFKPERIKLIGDE
jgi:hypothetical protein